jgi:2-phosphosulfolactate phosphatase
MLVDVVLLPRDLTDDHRAGRAVVVFDVLRATTTMTAALTAGVKEIFIQPDIPTVLSAAKAFGDAAVTCGEIDAVPPAGFTLGNSPGKFTNQYAGCTVFMATTNGTRAIIAAVGATAIFTGALVNATAVAKQLMAVGHDVTLLCSGSNGLLSAEDMIGAGAVIESLRSMTDVVLASDVAILAQQAFLSAKDDLAGVLSRTKGGKNIIRHDLRPDIEFCARLDMLGAVGVVSANPLVVRKM